jgi:hypothetical protein
VVSLPGMGPATLVGKAIPTGSACSGSAVAGTAANCASKGGNTACVTDTAPTVLPVAVVNNDAVPNVVPGSTGNGCQSYASGGTMCVEPAAGTPNPAAPQMGGTPDTPIAEITTSAGTTAYYSAAQTTASTNPVATGNTVTGGSAAGKAPGSGAGSGSGTGTGTSDDCALSGSEAGANDPAGCTGTLPSLTRADTVQSNIQGLYTGIGASPIVSALAAISTNMPSAGACPAASVTLTTLSNHSYDFLQTACTIFASDLSTLIAISDTIWAILGVLIVMSA